MQTQSARVTVPVKDNPVVPEMPVLGPIKRAIGKVVQLTLRWPLKLFGLRVVSAQESLIEREFLSGLVASRTKKAVFDEVKVTLIHLRDLTHNLPDHLNFDTQEEREFANAVLCRIWHIAEPYRCSIIPPQFVSSELKEKYINTRPFLSGPGIYQDTFDRIEMGCYESAMLLTKAIFLKNLPNYQMCPAWYQGSKTTQQEIKARLERQLQKIGEQLSQSTSGG